MLDNVLSFETLEGKILPGTRRSLFNSATLAVPIDGQCNPFLFCVSVDFLLVKA